MMSVYGILSVGIHLHLHYCCGKLADINFFNPAKSCCAADRDTSEDVTLRNNCCAFEDYDLKIEETHQASSFKVVFPQTIAEKVSFHSESGRVDSSVPHTSCLSDNGPPPDVPLFIKHQSLVFYA